ncbi:BrnA antitoxin family protein [Patescibacteria group bacterium]|nr:BrnA antitoxin family protein [Patescibacteria group bacterium]MCG2701867.1 BrnA antitoxin family protein [Candidatus Parcubacteria bacterium]MBU4210119.1 BrnA antitoxin family protein [Patescibacteria group bacterium]MBU4265420.1 BrnA antitoxin family protein [Patescibacteria group bacterium]MBU4390372.1 BrnA antitoxin family protein [Patescibacteria group bacterium]
MTKNKTKTIPNFKNRQQEAKFWDTHDFTDFLDQTKKVNLKVNLKAPKDGVLTIRLQPQLKKHMSQLATEMGTQTSTLARMWLIEKLKTLTPPYQST